MIQIVSVGNLGKTIITFDNSANLSHVEELGDSLCFKPIWNHIMSGEQKGLNFCRLYNMFALLLTI